MFYSQAIASSIVSRSKYNAQHPPPFAERIHYRRSSETSEIRAEISRSLLPQDEWHPVVPEASALTVRLRGTSRGYWPIANVPSRAAPRHIASHRIASHHVSPHRAIPMPCRSASAPRRAGVNAALGVSRPPRGPPVASSTARRLSLPGP